MKKQFLIIAATISAALFSCTKEKIETPPAATESFESISKPVIKLDPLSVGLLGRYEFNNTLKDTTGKLANLTSTVGRVIYTTDRKGVANRAVRFNQAYGLFVNNVPLGTNMSVSVWVQQNFSPINFTNIVEATRSFRFRQQQNIYMAGYWTGLLGVPAQFTLSGQIDDKWHHLVATRDDVSLKFYLDGNLIGSSPSPAGAGPYDGTSDYLVGYGYNNGYEYWKGSVDDLRIYQRVLSASDVNALHNL